jgi:AcrR family transcriptional regulator
MTTTQAGARAGLAAPGERAGERNPGRAGAGMLEPRKRPRQQRALMTFDAIVDACAQLLDRGGYEALTTNAISDRAGVSIGTLYEYFPNRDSIVAALATAACRRLVSRMWQAAEEAAALEPLEGVEHLLRNGVAALRAPENGLKQLMRQAPFVVRLPEFQEARAALDRLCREIAEASRARINLPDLEVDTWLISQMLFNAMVEIAGLEVGDDCRESRIRALARLTFRMAVGGDPPVHATRG